MMMSLTTWQGSSKVPAFLVRARKQTFLSTPVYGSMELSMSEEISTFLVLMAAF
jgi:hypothetical protein